MYARFLTTSTSLVLLLSLLAACGGGGGGGGGGGNTSSSSSTAPLQTQKVTFLFSQVLMTAGDTFGNVASGVGSGAITYSSSDTNVAVVDNQGRVTAKGAGTAIITATIAADGVYSAASATYTVTAKVLASQTLSFEQAGPITAMEGDVIVNVATGQGSGAVIYSSDKPDVATVNENGHVTTLKAGTAVITANKYRDDQFYDAQSSYTINVTASDYIKLSAWIGSTDTLLKFPTAANGLELYSSSSPTCDWLSHLNCLNNQFNLVNNDVITSNSTTLNAAGFYLLKNTSKKANIAISAQRFSDRSNLQVVSYKNLLFLFGGTSNNRLNDVWSSPDGRVWTQLTSNAQFSTLSDHKIISFKNKLWAIGGLSKSYSDIWSSTDGVNWIQEVVSAPFSARYFQQIVTFNNQLWLVGGHDDTGFKNDIWTSADGINWSLASPSAAFVADRRTVTGNGFGSYITNDELTVFKNKLWLFRPWMNANTNAELWSSVDGVNWEKVSTYDLNRYDYQIASYKGSLFVISGNNLGSGSVIQSSQDGINWSPAIPSNYSDDVTTHKVVVHNNQLISVGGSTYDDMGVGTDVLQSNDGLSWKKLTPYADFSARNDIQAVSFKDSIWVIGGNNKDDIWSSPDGINWAEHKSANIFSAKSYTASLIEFANKLWLIGGTYLTDGENDIWSSLDGISWTKSIKQPAFPMRSHQQVILHDNKLWLYGGYSEYTMLNDIWTSVDGINWTQKLNNAPFPARVNSAFTSYNGRLWIIGGIGQDQHFYNDVWSSTDGINWVQESSQAQFTPRYGHHVTVFENQLWLSAGDSGEVFENDIWKSADGITWTQQKNVAFPVRGGHKVVRHNDTLFLIGGVYFPIPNYPLVLPRNDVWSSTNGIDWRLGFRETFRFSE